MTSLEIFNLTHAGYIFAAFGVALCLLSAVFWRSFRLARISKNKLSKYLEQHK